MPQLKGTDKYNEGQFSNSNNTEDSIIGNEINDEGQIPSSTEDSTMGPPSMTTGYLVRIRTSNTTPGNSKSNNQRRKENELKVNRSAGMSSAKKLKMTKKGRIITPKKGIIIINNIPRITGVGEEDAGAKDDIKEDAQEEHRQAIININNPTNTTIVKDARQGAGEEITSQEGGQRSRIKGADTKQIEEDKHDDEQGQEEMNQRPRSGTSWRDLGLHRMNSISKGIHKGTKAKARTQAKFKQGGLDNLKQLGISNFLSKDKGLEPGKSHGNSQDRARPISQD